MNRARFLYFQSFVVLGCVPGAGACCCAWMLFRVCVMCSFVADDLVPIYISRHIPPHVRLHRPLLHQGTRSIVVTITRPACVCFESGSCCVAFPGEGLNVSRMFAVVRVLMHPADVIGKEGCIERQAASEPSVRSCRVGHRLVGVEVFDFCRFLRCGS